MDKSTFLERIQAIGTCEEDSARRELLTQLQEDCEKDYDHFSELETRNNKLIEDNESLRSANMKLFLRVGDHKKPDEPKPDAPIEKKEFKNLFDEKGNIK